MRGLSKQPGGKLVAVSVSFGDADKRPACRLDGDFFADGGDETEFRALLVDIEDSLSAVAADWHGKSANSCSCTNVAHPCAESSALRTDRAEAQAGSDVAASGYVATVYATARNAVEDAMHRHPSEQLVGVSAETIVAAFLKALGYGDNVVSSAQAYCDAQMCCDAQTRSVMQEQFCVQEKSDFPEETADHRASESSAQPETTLPDWRFYWNIINPVVIHDVPRSAAEQMDIDEQWAREVASGDRPATLRFWEWSQPAIVVGRFQSIPDEVNLERAQAEGFTVVRRCTGGGTMVVTPGGAITYSLYAPQNAFDGLDAAETYRVCDAWLVEALRAQGLDIDFQGLNDLASRSGKVGGAARRRFPAYNGGPGAVLHHTTVAYDLDGELMASVLNTSREKMSDKAVRSASRRVDPLCNHTNLTRNELVDYLIDAARRR